VDILNYINSTSFCMGHTMTSKEPNPSPPTGVVKPKAPPGPPEKRREAMDMLQLIVDKLNEIIRAINSLPCKEGPE